MKRILFTVLSMTTLTLTYAQETKTEKDDFRLISAGKLEAGHGKPGILFSEGVVFTVTNKLDMEADSVRYERNKGLLTAYGTKSFTFHGKVVMGKENKRVCRFRLGEDTLTIE